MDPDEDDRKPRLSDNYSVLIKQAICENALLRQFIKFDVQILILLVRQSQGGYIQKKCLYPLKNNKNRIMKREERGVFESWAGGSFTREPPGERGREAGAPSPAETRTHGTIWDWVTALNLLLCSLGMASMRMPKGSSCRSWEVQTVKGGTKARTAARGVKSLQLRGRSDHQGQREELSASAAEYSGALLSTK